jgi:hypothetical protein
MDRPGMDAAGPEACTAHTRTAAGVKTTTAGVETSAARVETSASAAAVAAATPAMSTATATATMARGCFGGCGGDHGHPGQKREGKLAFHVTPVP